MKHDVTVQPVVYFNREQRQELDLDTRAQLKDLILKRVDWTGSSEQTVEHRAHTVTFYLKARPHGTHKGWIDVGLARCNKSQIFHVGYNHGYCAGTACESWRNHVDEVAEA